MSFEQQDDTGSLFANDKQGNEKRPDCRGSAKIGGVEYQMSGWWREPKSGGKRYLYVKFDVPYDKTKVPRRQEPVQEPAPVVDMDDGIPF